MKKVVILGSTGSIGTQALEVVDASPSLFELTGISGGRNLKLFSEQIQKYRPKVIAGLSLPNESDLPTGVRSLKAGEEGILTLAALDEADIIVMGISGFAALRPLIASLKAGKNVALANKESIVCGHLMVDALISQYGGRILPVDSEQSAIFQCLTEGQEKEIDKILLTCSGGKFWQYEYEALRGITPEEALNHPTWNMGRKITVDSATLFNKGLEVMEAAYLFHVPGEKIQVVIHPQSVVHSMVSFVDGSVFADMSLPDMRLPIQYALTWPERKPSPCKKLDLGAVRELTFYDAPSEKYPALRLSYEALTAGGTMPTVYNAANEAAVNLFFERKLPFTGIYEAVENAMLQHKVKPADSIENILSADAEARKFVYDQYNEEV